MLKNNFELQILIHGKPVREYSHEGHMFVEGRKGQEYSLRIKNNSGRRILAVPTVDGLSVIDGEKGSFESRGYVIDKYDSVTIDGWRTSDNDVAKFYFDDKVNSYANSSHAEENEGAIGVAIFYEHNVSHTYVPYVPFTGGDALVGSAKVTFTRGDTVGDFRENTIGEVTCFNASGASAEASSNVVYAAAVSNAQDIGTGWGESKRSEVMEASFDRCRHPEAVLELIYNTRGGLEKMGVKFSKPKYVTPSAFPNNKYCKPPCHCAHTCSSNCTCHCHN